MSNELVGKVIAKLSALSGAQFASFTYRAKESGELARHTVILNFSMRTLYEKDVQRVEEIIATETDPLKLQAANEILSSLAVSLQGGIGNNPAYTHSEEARGEGNQTYVLIPSLPGVMVHRETGEVYVKGLSERKVVLEPGTYKEVKSKPLTIAKNAVRKELRSGKVRQYSLGQLVEARINGETLELETA